MSGTRVRSPWRAAAAVCAAAALAGCYTYTEPGEVSPEVGRTFAFDLTDQGRAALSDRIGPGTDRIEGDLVGLTDTAYRVRVARVVDIRGKVVGWSGEEVSFGREYVGTLRERRKSPVRTGIAIGMLGAGVVAVIAIATLEVSGFESGPPSGQDPDAEGSRHFPLTLYWSR
jgi:hypothetical protein